ncbi:hypothetical protein N7528_000306 [Penicillium herquei]|nr:hypothetical protein N7528_000306 [Penicillium herquei]
MSAEVIIQPSYSASSALIALLQVLYAASTLYESKGYQISRYGYAAFGFTVLPYLVMSVMNLVGTLVTPNYPSAYLVHTEIMDEAIKRGGHFNTIVGKLESDGLPVKEFYVFGGSFQPQKDSNNLWNLKLTSKIFNIDETEPLLDNTQNMQQGVVVSHATVASQEQDTSNISSASSPPENEQKKPSRYQPRIIVPSCYNFKQIPPSPPINVPIGFMFWSISPRTLIATWLRWFISAIPLIAIGVISHFKPESSTLAERVWIMLWLIMGMVVDPHPYFADYVIGLYLDRPAAFRRIFEKDRYHNRLDFYGDLWGLTSRTFTTIVYNLVANAVSIGRIVVVWQMLDAYGSCTSLD